MYSKMPTKPKIMHLFQFGLPTIEKYLNLEDILEKSLKIKSVLKSTGKSLKITLNSTIFL